MCFEEENRWRRREEKKKESRLACLAVRVAVGRRSTCRLKEKVDGSATVAKAGKNGVQAKSQHAPCQWPPNLEEKKKEEEKKRRKEKKRKK